MTESLDTETVLNVWSQELTGALNVPDLVVDVTALLDLAADAAHTVLRPAAPVSTFVVGYAAGLAAARGTAPDVAVAEAITIARELCLRRAG